MRAVVEVGGGVDKAVRAVAYDGGVADLADPFEPGRQSSGEVGGVPGGCPSPEDRFRRGELDDVERDLAQRGQGVKAAHLGRARWHAVEHDDVAGRRAAVEKGVA